LILMFLRIQIKREIIDNVNLEKMRHGLYPVSSLDSSKKKDSQYTVNFNEVLEAKEQIDQFMLNGGVHTGQDDEAKDYIPYLDERGPFMFFPPQCVPLPEVFVHASPIIGYIKSNSTIQAKLIGQLKAHVDNQIGSYDMIMKEKMLKDFITEHKNRGKSKEQI
jgi:hypothetical protein